MFTEFHASLDDPSPAETNVTKVVAQDQLKGIRRELLTESKNFQNEFFDKIETLPQSEI